MYFDKQMGADLDINKLLKHITPYLLNFLLNHSQINYCCKAFMIPYNFDVILANNFNILFLFLQNR